MDWTWRRACAVGEESTQLWSARKTFVTSSWASSCAVPLPRGRTPPARSPESWCPPTPLRESGRRVRLRSGSTGLRCVRGRRKGAAPDLSLACGMDAPRSPLQRLGWLPSAGPPDARTHTGSEPLCKQTGAPWEQHSLEVEALCRAQACHSPYDSFRFLRSGHPSVCGRTTDLQLYSSGII